MSFSRAELRLVTCHSLTEGDRRKTKERCLKRTGNGAGICYVVSEVTASVDATQNQIGPTVTQIVTKREHHTIRRASLNGKTARPEFAHLNCLVEGQGMTRATLFFLGCEYPNIFREGFRNSLKHLNARRPDTVVIDHQYTRFRQVQRRLEHRHYLSTGSIFSNPPIYARKASGTVIEPSEFW